jgi:hypothetical protein
MMKRIAASNFSKCQSESEQAGQTLPPQRRAAPRAGRKVRHHSRASYRARFRSAPLRLISISRPPRRPKLEPAREVVDDFPVDIPVLPGELQVIETYLGAVTDESLERMGSDTDQAACEIVKRNVE